VSNEIFYPRPTVDGGNYDWSSAVNLAQVMTGPCVGIWYVSTSTLKCDRETVIDKYIKNGAAAPAGASVNFFDHQNTTCFYGAPFDAADFVQATENHEYRGTPDAFKSLEGHQGRIEKILFETVEPYTEPLDPKQYIERMVDQDSEQLALDVNNAITTIEGAVREFVISHEYSEAIGPNWGADNDSLGWGNHSLWNTAGSNWTSCTHGPANF
jgi:hypothetical protein